MAILTVTLNPALDLETRTPELVPGRKLRCLPPRRDPGGGGINVARAIAILGGEATAAVAAGGATGDDLARRLETPGTHVARLPAPGETRQNLSVIEEGTGAQYRFIFPGPSWEVADLRAAEEALLPLVAAGDIVVLSGSMPPGLAPGAMVDLARDLRDAGAAVVCDTSGPALSAVAGAGLGLAMLRMDSAEAEELVGRRLRDVDDSAAAASELVARGAARIAILARGAEGSVLAAAGERWFAPAAQVPVVSVTGAGDSFVAGATLALSRGAPLAEVLQWGVAAASSAVTTEATLLCDRATFESIFARCAAHRL
ncbi:1-phosphofructokinase family hexose kinase [Roseicyclus sp.]|uniref:1-phosphofructokinase family hexose kinase n=1 Tax=Roseicyclus sp. TaxID=1914329 RepID=UPI003FA1079D